MSRRKRRMLRRRQNKDKVCRLCLLNDNANCSLMPECPLNMQLKKCGFCDQKGHSLDDCPGLKNALTCQACKKPLDECKC